MKKYPSILAAAIVATGVQIGDALDITFSDPHNDKNFSNQNIGANGAENNTVQYNAIANQTWDLESFNLDGSNLSITGGFNFLTGQGTGTSRTYPMGDIFVYLGTQAPYSVPSPGDHNGPWTGRDDWDYVIRFGRTASSNISAQGNEIGYSIEAKGNQTVHYTGGTGALNEGLPWMVNGGSFTPTQTAALTSFGDSEGTHYTIGGIDIQLLLNLNQSLYLHATMKCGNDVLWGRLPDVSVPQVPDSGTGLTLMGLAIGVLGFVRSRK